MVIRPARVTDADALASLAARTFAETFAANTPQDDMAVFLATTYGEQQQRREIEDPTVLTLVAESEKNLVAFAQLRRGPVPAAVRGDAPLEVQRFYVDRPWHGRGLAAQLMARVMADATSAGAAMLWLGVWEGNARAIAFYRRQGFTDVGAQTFVVGTDVQTDRLMQRPIVAADTLTARAPAR